MLSTLNMSENLWSEPIRVSLRSIETNSTNVLDPQIRKIQQVEWEGKETAVIVCDVWDLHHCLNAVRRLEEFAPRLDQVLAEARKRGAIIIHAPSDCMPAYADHPARLRATKTPKSRSLPPGIEHWCSRIPQEKTKYPIDQSDGGEDDDPTEHAAWAAKLKSMGRNPGTPWQRQSDLIHIDGQLDYISDRGDEVWSILEKHGVKNVILTGVHCNMCVLGRPFGLRQMVRNKKQVVLMRDMTDSMYSPKSWPFVDHYTGHDAVIDYVESNICPTITSDQLLGGEPFRWKSDTRPRLPQEKSIPLSPNADFTKHWITLVPTNRSAFETAIKEYRGSVWYRGALRVPDHWLSDRPVLIELPERSQCQVWLNGRELPKSDRASGTNGKSFYALDKDRLAVNDYNLIVLKWQSDPTLSNRVDAALAIGDRTLNIESGWQSRLDEDPRNSEMLLPAKFGIGPDAVLQVQGRSAE
jgi:nicotinamidase-related amidase